MSTPDKDEQERRKLGDRLRQAREYLNYSQDEVAQHLNIPRTAVSGFEAGQRRVEALELKKLAALYRQPISYLTGEDKAAAPLPADVAHLARKAAELSSKDREELQKFAEYLQTRAKMDGDEQ